MMNVVRGAAHIQGPVLRAEYRDQSTEYSVQVQGIIVGGSVKACAIMTFTSARVSKLIRL